jgi:hypothetical protein
MYSRFKHVNAKPFMKYELECNTIYPVIYLIPKNANALFLALLENSRIKTKYKISLLTMSLQKFKTTS